jgi:hypothetical protein
MNREIARQGLQEAEKELRRRMIDEVKKIALQTLEELQKVDKTIRELQQKKRFLKMDIDDLKEGRLDRIVERHEKDEDAKSASVVLLHKGEADRGESPYYWPYNVTWKDDSGHFAEGQVQINCSVARHNVVGTYSLPNGEVVHLR